MTNINKKRPIKTLSASLGTEESYLKSMENKMPSVTFYLSKIAGANLTTYFAVNIERCNVCRHFEFRFKT